MIARLIHILVDWWIRITGTPLPALDQEQCHRHRKTEEP